MMALNPPPSPPLSSLKAHKYNNYVKVPYIVSSYPQSSQENLFPRLFTCRQDKTTLHVSIDTLTNTF